MATSAPGIILPLHTAARWATAARRCGLRLVATNGCFDLLHAGHVQYLTRARRCGDLLVVGLNSDRSVRQLKGPGRPLVPARERAAVLAALRMVDAVVIFPQKRATRFLEAIQPAVYVKGGDYRPASLDKDERAVLNRLRTRIRIVPFVRGRSTTALLAKLKRL